MIFLDPYDPRILEARQKHLDKLLPIIIARVDALPPGNLKNFLNEFKVRRILSDLPDNLENHHLEYLDAVHAISSPDWQNYLSAIYLPSTKRSIGQSLLIGRVEFVSRISSNF